MEQTICFEHVSMHFGRKTVLDHFDMTVPQGSVYALLGRNGAGKSTAIRLLTGELLPDSGSIRVLGMNPVTDGVALRTVSGYVRENQHLFDTLKLGEYLRFLECFYADWNRNTEQDLLRRFRLAPSDRIGTLSRGMYAKAALLGVLCRHPKLLILDDPTLGLDTAARREFMDCVLECVEEFQPTVLLTGHFLPELEGLCDYAGLLRDGHLVLHGTIDELKNSAVLVTACVPFPEQKLPGEAARKQLAGEYQIVLHQSREEAVAMLEKEWPNGKFRLQNLSLEELFIYFS